MDNQIKKETLHHAYRLIGTKDDALLYLDNFLKQELRFESARNPDYHFFSSETLGIANTRELKEVATLKPYGDISIIVSAFSFISSEAQNALLKLLEEPASGTHLFLITNQELILLPTLSSRLQTVHIPQNTFGTRLAREFLSAPIDKRLSLVAHFKDSEYENKKSELLNLISECERLLGREFRDGAHELRQSLSELLTLKQYLFDKAPSVKMIAEYLALRLPVKK